MTATRLLQKCTICEKRRQCALCESCGERYCSECSRKLQAPQSQTKLSQPEKWLCIDCEEEAQAYASFGIWGAL